MSGPVVAAHRANGDGRAVSVLWLVAGVLAASQMLATIQSSALRCGGQSGIASGATLSGLGRAPSGCCI